MQRSTILFFCLALVGGCILFKVKYAVVEMEQKLAQTLHQIEHERETIHILKAEWSHLNEPQRLKKLAEKYLDIMPMKTNQIAAVVNKSNMGTSGNVNGDRPQPHLASMKGLQ